MDTVVCSNCEARITEAEIVDTDTCPRCKKSGCLQDAPQSNISLVYGDETVEVSLPVARVFALAMRVYSQGVCDAPSFFCRLCPVTNCARDDAKEKLEAYF